MVSVIHENKIMFTVWSYIIATIVPLDSRCCIKNVSREIFSYVATFIDVGTYFI